MNCLNFLGFIGNYVPMVHSALRPLNHIYCFIFCHVIPEEKKFMPFTGVNCYIERLINLILNKNLEMTERVCIVATQTYFSQISVGYSSLSGFVIPLNSQSLFLSNWVFTDSATISLP